MKYILLVPLYFYKFIISPFLTPVLGHGCKFETTCSEYAIISIKRYGVWKGIRVSLERLAKCHSWNRY